MKNIIIFAAIIFLCQCKKDPAEPYSNENIVMDNAQATLYFHTIFREAENAWAFINDKNYQKGTYQDEGSRLTISKKLTYDEKTVTIEYNAWETNHLNLSGSITVSFGISSYRKEGSVANIYLTDFWINQQSVVGGSSIKFIKKVAGKEKEEKNKDNYTFTLLEGAAIYRKGYSMPLLISCTIAKGGEYERTKGNETLKQDDDEWVYSGVMTGMLRDDPDLKYTNTVLNTYTDDKGDRIDGKIVFTNNCITAKQGVSEIKIAKRPNIVFWYDCNGCFFGSVTHIE